MIEKLKSLLRNINEYNRDEISYVKMHLLTHEKEFKKLKEREENICNTKTPRSRYAPSRDYRYENLRLLKVTLNNFNKKS